MELSQFWSVVLFLAVIIGSFVTVHLAKEFLFKKKSSVIGSKTSQQAVRRNTNYVFLEAVRMQSCYATLRNAHAALTALAVVAILFVWISLMTRTRDVGDGWYATFTCGAVIVALLIEYGLFRLIVDAVDVLIDTSRRTAERL